MSSTPQLPDQSVTPTRSADVPPSQSQTPAADDSALPKTASERGNHTTANIGRDRVGMYQLLGELARGGMGIVYKARHVVLERIVALKVMRADARIWPQDEERFQREMQATARLSHANILPIYEIGWQDSQPYYTMPCIEGGSLAHHRNRLLTEPRAALAIMAEVARAVQYAHDHGIIHRDLKPANVLLDHAGTPFVTDFGLAKMIDDNAELTHSGAVMGTPGYMAPEQAAGQTRRIGPSTDVWALGVMLYELLTGRRPFLGESGEEVKDRIRNDTPPPPRSLQPAMEKELERLVLKCLEKDPAKRYPSAAALADDLERYLRQEPPLLRGDPETLRLDKAPRGRKFVAIALAVCLAMLLAATLHLISRRDHPTGETSIRPPEGESAGDRVLPPPLVLIDEHQAAPGARWLAGKANAAINKVPPQGAFSVTSDSISLLALCDAPPWPRYRLEARIRDEKTDPWGQAGIFFAMVDYPTEKGVIHVYCELGFGEMGRRRQSNVDLLVWSLEDFFPFTPNRAEPFAVLPFRFDPVREGISPVRELAVEVDAEEVRAFWGAICIRKVSRQQLQQRCRRIVEHFDIVGDFTPEGPLGIYVTKGSATFPSVVLKPLP